VTVLLEAAGPQLLTLLLRLTLRRDVAEDLMQDLFVRLSRSRSFRRAENQVGFAVRTAVNLAMDWRRAEARRERAVDRRGARIDPGVDGVLGPGQREELGRVLDAAARMRGVGREAFVLRYVHGLGYEAVGAALGRTPHQARALCHKSLLSVRRALEMGRALTPEKGKPCTA
jgi:RNA polymerase sigma-70 factor (ECF subfamily)